MANLSLFIFLPSHFTISESPPEFYSIRFEEHEIEAPLKLRTIEDIQALQENARMIWVIGSIWASIFELELPPLSFAKAKAAIPFALEDQIAQNISESNFFYQKLSNTLYRIIVIDKSSLKHIVETIHLLGFRIDFMTLDWFALKKGDILKLEHYFLMYTDEVKGAISFDIALNIKENITFDHHDKQMIWLAERIRESEYLNLYHDEFKGNVKQKKIKKYYLISAILAGTWFITLLLSYGFYLYQLNQQNKNLETQITRIYRHYFPGATQVISPKFRITQWLKEHQNKKDIFWSLWEKFSQAFKDQSINLINLRYQNERLFLTVSTKDFSMLETFQRKLRDNSLKVSQTEANTQGKKGVSASLELRL